MDFLPPMRFQPLPPVADAREYLLRLLDVERRALAVSKESD